MPCFKRCCCCVTLRMGGITMGVMTLALSVFSIVPAAIAFANQTQLAQIVVHFIRQQNKTGQASDGGSNEPAPLWGVVTQLAKGDTSRLPPEDDPKVMHMADVMFYFFIICIVLLAVYLLCSILLIVGACKGSRWCLLPWIVATFLYLLAYLGGCCLSMHLFGGQIQIILLLAIAIVETGIGFYLWLCIVSLFQILGSDEWRVGNGNSDWEMKPRFSTNYNSVPTHD